MTNAIQLLPINDHESMLEAFWNGEQNADGSRRDLLAAWRTTWGEGATGSVRPPGQFTITTPGPGGTVLILDRDCQVPLRQYDTLTLVASLPAAVQLRLEACLDGRWQTLIDAPGTDGVEEYAGEFRGAMLSGMRLLFTVIGPTPMVLSLHSLIVADAAGLARSQARRPVPDAAWPGLLAAPARPAQPRLGLFFGGDDLTALRDKLQSPALRPHYKALLARAEDLLSIDPERQVGPYAPGSDLVRGGRKRDANTWIAAGVADVLAFAGVVADEPRYSRHAARMALAICHCEHWTPGPAGSLAGATAHPRCFVESYLLRALPLVLDWAGDYFTPAGRELVRDAMILKGLARVESDFHRWEYIRRMNQGLLFTPGRVAAYLALEATYPRYAARLREAERDLHSMLKHYLQPDGGTLEGMGYWHSVGEVFPTLYALARRNGRPFAEGLGERVRRTADYALAMLSSTGDGDHFLTINAAGQGHLQPSLSMAAVFAQSSGDPRWSALYDRLLRDHQPTADWFHLLLARPPAVRAQVPPPGPAFYHFPVTGHAGLRRPAAGLGEVRVHLFSGPSRGGHSHQDKGSFIIEASGESLATDRGTTAYDNPAHLLMGKAAWHNLAVPEDADGTPLEQQPLHTPGGRLTAADYRDGVLDLRCNNRRAWAPGLFRRNRRRLWSPVPELILLDDELLFHHPYAVSFRLNSPFPITQEADGCWHVTGERATLRILPANWSPVAAAAAVSGVNCWGKPVWLLRLAVPPARRHRLLTLLQICPTQQKNDIPPQTYGTVAYTLLHNHRDKPGWDDLWSSL